MTPCFVTTGSITEDERKRRLGRIGEKLACDHLIAAGLHDVHNLNEREKQNSPFADVAGMKSRVTYYFSVKTCNRYQRDGSLNTGYKIGNLPAAQRLHDERCVVCKWIAVSVDTERGIYSCYHGTISELVSYSQGNLRIRMTDKATRAYNAFAVDLPCPYDVSQLRNKLPRVPRSGQRQGLSAHHYPLQ
jgi:hypothetical protein